MGLHFCLGTVGTMKISRCHYSGYKIYPGHGKTMVKVDGKSFNFLNSKCERAHMMKRNPRNTTWTVLYRQVGHWCLIKPRLRMSAVSIEIRLASSCNATKTCLT